MTLNRDFNVTPIGIFDVEYGINSTRLIDTYLGLKWIMSKNLLELTRTRMTSNNLE